MPKLDILPLAGAFPQLSLSGDVCVETPGIYHPRFIGTSVSDRRLVWRTETNVKIGIPPNGDVAFGHAVPRLAAGHGSFAVSFQPRPGEATGIWLNGTLQLDPVGGVLGADAYNWMSPEGDVLWLTPFQSERKSVMHRAPNGVIRTVATMQHAECARMSGGLITFKGDGATWWAILQGDSYLVQRVAAVGEASIAPIPLRVAEGYWVLEQYASRGGYCLHPIDSTRGYRVAGLDTFNPDAAVINGDIWVVSQQRVGSQVELRKFNLAETRIDLAAQPELPVIAPQRPFFVGAFHHRHTEHAEWGDLTVSSRLDVLSDGIAPIRPSLLGPDAIIFAGARKDRTDFVKGLFISLEGGGPADVDVAAHFTREIWLETYGYPIPPVVAYLTEDQRVAHGADFQRCDVDVWAPECYWPLAFPSDAHTLLLEELEAWNAALGTTRPWLIVAQAFDRNGAHIPVMDEVARLQPLFLNEGARLLHTKGALFFDVNRSGMFKYPELARQFERMAAVCSPPAELAPWREAPTPEPEPLPGPPTVTFLYSPAAAQLKPGTSVPVRAVATIMGQATTIRWFKRSPTDFWVVDAENAADDKDHTFRFFQPGRYEIAAEALNLGNPGPRVTAPVSITLAPPESPLPTPDELSLDILRAADWLTFEVYNTDPANHPPTAGRLIDAPIDWVGYKQWLLHNYMRAYRIDQKFDHGTALTYTYGDIYAVLNEGRYPPTDPRSFQ